MIFSTYPSILLYQSFGKWKRMSNLPPAMFVGLWNTSKRFFRSKNEKMTFPTNSHRASFGLPVRGNGNKCCVCCLKKQHMLPKISFSKSIRSQVSNAIFHVPSRPLDQKTLYFEKKYSQNVHLRNFLTLDSLSTAPQLGVKLTPLVVVNRTKRK